jgi:hypothetical protein
MLTRASSRLVGVSFSRLTISRFATSQAFDPIVNNQPSAVSLKPPEGFNYLWVNELESALLVPRQWHVVKEQGNIGGTGTRIIISKENALELGWFETGITFSIWDTTSISPDVIKDQHVRDCLGTAAHRYVSRVDSLMDLTVLRNIYSVEILNFKQSAAKNFESTCDSFTLVKYQQKPLQVEVPPSDIYLHGEVVVFPATNRVISMLLECPLADFSEGEQVLDLMQRYTLINTPQNERHTLHNIISQNATLAMIKE